MWSLLISLLFSSGVSAPMAVDAHDFHVSRLTSNYNPEEGRIECTLMTFVDDVESILTNHHQLKELNTPTSTSPSKESLNLTESDEHASVDSLLVSYLREVIVFKSASSTMPLALSYLGKERDSDPYGMFIYFFIEDVPLSAKLELSSSYMLELYEDQQNVVVWKLDGESADYDLLTYNTRDCDFER